MKQKQPLPWWSSPRSIMRYILMLDDTPHSVALGTAIGVFIGLTPTVGIQMILVMLLAAATGRLFQFNRVAALLAVYISNPLTMVPLYWFLYWVGTWFVPGHRSHSDLKELDFHNSEEWWNTISTLFVDFGTPLLVGTAIVATIGGLVTYPVMLWVLGHVSTPKLPTDDEPASFVASGKDLEA